MRKLPFDLSALAGLAGAKAAASARLTPLEAVAPDPGNLAGWTFVPRALAERPGLVVALHGCTQTAAAYDLGSGWSALAERHGFVMLYPEQRRANNPNLCFNWFAPEDSARGQGEAQSIRAMIEAVVRRHGIDPSRIFVTGLSAGGAMAAVMLATYPELFAGGAIIAGLPYGCASNVPEALGMMRARTAKGETALADRVRAASAHRGPWPTVSIWHGSGDATVNPDNAAALVEQWRGVHGLAAAPDVTEIVDGYPRRAWRDAGGRELVEEYSITGLGHGTPLATLGEDPCGQAGPYMLEAAISSTRRIAAFWGLLTTHHANARTVAEPDTPPERLPAERTVRATRMPPPPPVAAPGAGIGRIIEDALRSAGLMR